MVDQTLLDDVKNLLEHGFDDDRILKQILRACQRDEVISNYERNYVTRLVETHLKKKPSFSVDDSNDSSSYSTSSPQQHPSTSIPSSPTTTTTTPPTPNTVPPLTSKSLQIQPLPKPSSKSFFNSKKGKILLGIGIVITLIIIITAAAFLYLANSITNDGVGTIDVTGPGGVTPIGSPPTALAGTLVQTDASLYMHKDLISISGAFNSNPGTAVYLSIEDPTGAVVWDEQLFLKSNKEFSTITIAGGIGWDDSGSYTLIAETDTDVVTTIFSFTR